MKTNLTIQEVDIKTSKAGKAYHAVKTSAGAMSCFEQAAAEKLTAAVGQSADVEVEERNGFKNITKFYGATGAAPAVTEERVTNTPDDKYAAARQSKDVSMATSYAKDIFCRIYDTTNESVTLEQWMDLAIRLVLQARTAFEQAAQQ